MRPEAGRYRAFLLRVWIREEDQALLSSVRDVETGETRAFSNLDQLNEWLSREMNRQRARRSRSTENPGRRCEDLTRHHPVESWDEGSV